MGDDTAEVPKSGYFYRGGNADPSDTDLPNYRGGVNISITTDLITLTNCYHAFRAVIHKARLIIFELARRQSRQSWFSRLRDSRCIALGGDARKLDEQLADLHEGIERRLSVDDLVAGPHYDLLGDVPISIPFKRLIYSHDRLSEIDRDLKRHLLSLEKGFRQNVVEPLKQNLIHQTIPDYSALTVEAQKVATEFDQAAYTYRSAVNEIGKVVIGSTSWGDVKRIASDIDGLMRTANGLGWEQHNDQEFEGLNLSKVFDSAEAPQKIIDYLEDKVRSLRHENSLPLETPETKDRQAGTRTHFRRNTRNLRSSSGRHGEDVEAVV
ncbi:hypothetical protein G647_00419 [Cladophialophora carrionii CBS 160.54]|uniref:Uncharacterized protein n=1 Tax=Cladophialophora carrionii CBS 160.54 TaxID=1279043 RepID=V9DM84_9EURO|nr:uncharacterized protein G647_00419 [Cladophialophora carrionii CBS 160.54]ETI27970.1 hypothetical protein G647_00419 [Cladophialophora carrionii CBS 160.54]